MKKSGKVTHERAPETAPLPRKPWRSLRDYSVHLLYEHPAVVVGMVLGVLLIASGMMHLQVTGVSFGISLSDPIDSILIALLVATLSLLVTAAWVSLPALFTAATVRCNYRSLRMLGAGGFRFATFALIYCSAFSLWSISWQIDEAGFALKAFAIAGLDAAFVTLLWGVWSRRKRARPKVTPAPNKPGRRRHFRAWILGFLWLLGVSLFTFISSHLLVLVAERSKWFAGTEGDGLLPFATLSVLLGLMVFSSALIIRGKDLQWLKSIAIVPPALLCIVGVLTPIYSEAMRVTRLGQYGARDAVFEGHACKVVAALDDIKLRMMDDDSCVAARVFIVSLSAERMVVAATRERSEAGGRAHLAGAAYVGGEPISRKDEKLVKLWGRPSPANAKASPPPQN